MERTIDWEAVTSKLLAGCDKPAAILESDLRFLLVNQELEALLGASHGELLGRSWPETCAPRSEAGVASERLRASVGRSAHAWEETIYSTDGRVLRVSVEAQDIGPDRQPLLLIRVLRWTLVRASAPPGFDTDHHYEICAAAEDFGTIRSFWSAGAPLSESYHVGRRCYEVLYGRPKRCGSCPAERAFLDGAPLTIALRGSPNQARFRVMTAEPSSKDSVAISVRELDASVATAMIHARIDDLAHQARLTSRERGVLELLLLGRSPDDIAKVLGIAPRTAKFHQTNLLLKLGADSRHDLLRLLV